MRLEIHAHNRTPSPMQHTTAYMYMYILLGKLGAKNHTANYPRSQVWGTSYGRLPTHARALACRTLQQMMNWLFFRLNCRISRSYEEGLFTKGSCSKVDLCPILSHVILFTVLTWQLLIMSHFVKSAIFHFFNIGIV